jgi:hypothetical protein
MRNQYPISSQEFNDIVIEAYGNLCYLLGYNDSVNDYSGVYDRLDASGLSFMNSTSGILHIGNVDAKYQLGLSQETTSEMLIQYLKYDYLHRKSLNYI